MTTRLAALVAVLLVLGSLSSCRIGNAPAKHDSIESDLELLGHVKPADIDRAIDAVGKSLGATSPPRLDDAKLALKSELSSVSEKDFDVLWRGVEARIGRVDPNQPEFIARVRDAVRVALTNLINDTELYWLANDHPATCTVADSATCAQCLRAKNARDELITRFITRIEDYHETNNDDVFQGTVEVGLSLDVGTTIASALATAFTPLSTKTALSAAAAICSGTRLAASRNVLNEKSSSAILNAMISERADKLAVIYRKMSDTPKQYSVHQATIDLVNYFNAGGLYRAIAAVDAEVGNAKKTSEKNLDDSKSHAKGNFQAGGVAPGDKDTAEIQFTSKESVGTITVANIQFSGVDVPADQYTTENVDNATQVLRIKFKSEHLPKKGDLVVVLGTSSVVGSHVGVIVWP